MISSTSESSDAEAVSWEAVLGSGLRRRTVSVSAMLTMLWLVICEHAMQKTKRTEMEWNW